VLFSVLISQKKSKIHSLSGFARDLCSEYQFILELMSSIWQAGSHRSVRAMVNPGYKTW
jgi:hypothetical protein